ncbi:MAG: AsmA family protein [Gammaproteobacteria bacterium]|nr:MAG: AsmA family protein [Gammaproteobacteria bacterium]
MIMKSALKIIGYIFVFIVGAVIIAALMVDANTFKPRIQAMAQEQGIALNMRGDLSWAFWPAIGVAVNEVSVASVDTPEEFIASVKKASFLVAFIPLLKGDFHIKHIIVDEAVIDLNVDEQGKGNWERLLKKKQPGAQEKPAAPNAANGEIPTISIEEISVHDSKLTYINLPSGQKFSLTNLNLDADDVNLAGEPFAVDFSSDTEISQTKGKSTPTTIKSKLHTNVAIAKGGESIAIDKGELSLDIKAANSASIKLEYSVALSDVKNNLNFKGHMSLNKFSLKQLLNAFGVAHKTANASALSEVSLEGNFAGDKKHLAFDAVSIHLDKTQLKGKLAINDFATQSITADLQGDAINVDDYLAPKADENAPVAAKTATGDEPLIPVETLRKLKADLKLGFQTFIFSDLTLEKVMLTINAKNGILQQQINASAFSGNIHQKAEIDSRGQAAHVNFEAVLQGIEVEPILKAKKLDKDLHLSGAIQANSRGQATGVTTNQIMDSLTADATLSGAKIRLAPLNVEQQFCKFIALVNRDEMSGEEAKTWNAYTELRELTGKLTIAKRVVTIDSLNAGVEKLLLSSTGNINLATGNYDFSLPLKLVRDANDTPKSITTSTNGCTVTSNYWAERSMSLLRCKGKYVEISPAQDCRPDKDMLNAVIKDFAEYKLKAKYGEKVDAKKEELKQKLEEKLGEGGAEKAKNALKNLFKKKEEKAEQ